MNQILDYNPNKKSSGSSSGSDKVVRVFAVLLVIFSICLLGSGLYGIYKNKETEKGQEQKPTYATISTLQEGEQVTVSVTHDKAIEKMIYSWNTSAERSVPGGSAKTLEKVLDLPAGTNTLHIKVIDSEGVESSYEEEFVSESGLDILNPVISINVVDGEGEEKLKKLKISATDETQLDFITYRWNDEDEVKVEATEENPKEISLEIDILRGTNDITIVAVDSSNNTTTETKSFTALTKPEITVTLSADGSSLDITATHENGIASVYYTLNDQPYEGTFDNNPTTVQFAQGLEVGYNRIILTVKSVDNTETVFDGECTYEPPVEEPAPEELPGEGEEQVPAEGEEAPAEEQTEEGTTEEQ